MSSQLKTAIVIDDSLIFDGNTIDAINHNNPLEDAQDQLREGQVAVSSGDTHVKHLEDAITGASGAVKVTKQDSGADESLELDLDATGISSGYVATANGSNGWSWAASGGGGAQPVDVNGTAGEALSERDYVYLEESSGTWFKIDIDATPIKCGRVRGIVNESGGISSAATGSIRLIGEVSGYAGLTAWQPVYASSTPGSITQTRPSPTSGGAQVVIIQIGIAISTTAIVVLPQQPAQYMKRDDALANNDTLTITHHEDAMAHLRRAFAYIGSSESGVTLTSYADTNQDDDLMLKNRTIATYGSDLSGTGTASASSAVSSTAASATDDDDATSWIANATTGWHKVDYGVSNEKTIRRYTITSDDAGAAANQAPKDWTFEGSNDDSSWDTLDTVTGETSWGAAETRTFSFYNDTAYRYYRINISANNGSGSYVAMAEIEHIEAATYNDGNQRLSQSFQISSGNDVNTVRLYLKKAGTPTGNLTIKIQTDSSGDPSGTTVTNGTSDTVAASTLSTSYGWIDFTFSTDPTLSGSTTYHIVLETTDSYHEVDYVLWGIDSSSPSYADGEAKEYDGSWASASADAIFDVKASGTTFVEPAVMGRWSGGTRDIAIRYDDGTGSDGDTKTTCKNVIGATADVTLVVEIS